MKTRIVKTVSEIFHNPRHAWYICISVLFVILGSKSAKTRLFLRIYATERAFRKYEFAKFAKDNLYKSYSVDYQDLLVLFLFNKTSYEKTFLELGGCDGIYKSNCYLLEKNLWQGIIVEANPVYYDSLTKNRNTVIKAAVTSQELSQVELLYIESIPSSGSIMRENFDKNLVVKKVLVQTIHIDNLNEIYLKFSPKGATYVSLDIEGGEELLLEKIITNLDPKIISIEHNNNLEKLNKIEEVANLYSYHEIYKHLTRNESIFTKL